MARFNRGLDDDFVARLNEMYDEGDNWWHTLVNDEELFFAIRENYVNIYHRGRALLRKLKLTKRRGIVGETHYKYLLKPNAQSNSSKKPSKKYVRIIVDGRLDFSKAEALTDIRNLKKAMERHVKPEDSGIYDIIPGNENVIDTEIAHQGARIDFLALRKTKDGVEMRFFEAKRFKNGDLQKREGDAKVIGQIDRYSHFLKKKREEVVDSYRRVCCNLLKLKGLKKRYPRRHTLLQRIKDGKPLSVNTDPWLVIFDFEDAELEKKNWPQHHEKLKEQLGERILLKGSARNIRL